MQKIRIKRRKESYDFWNFKEMLSYLWSIPLQFFPYCSLEAAKDNVKTIFELIIEIASSERERISECRDVSREKAFLTRTKNNAGNLIKIIDKKKSANNIQVLIYDMILSLEGKALLPGFGFCTKIHKDKLRGNPEKQSLLKGY